MPLLGGVRLCGHTYSPFSIRCPYQLTRANCSRSACSRISPFGAAQPRSRCPALNAKSKKGFGNVQKHSEDDDNDSQQKSGSKKRTRQLAAPGPLATSEQRGLQNTSLRNVEELEKQLQRQAEEDEFGKRLALIRAEGELRAAEAEARKPSKASSLDATSPLLSVSPKGRNRDSTSSLDGPVDIYANPPSLAQTLLGQYDADVSDPKLRQATFGPGTPALAAGAIIFGLIFLLVSGGDMSPSTNRKTARPAMAPPDAIEEGVLKTRVAALEQELAQRPNDPAILEPLALTYAKLFRFEEAADKLERLVIQRPGDVDAWRVLGESSLLANQPARSVGAYQKAAQLSATALGNGPDGMPSLQVLTGYIDAFVANGQQKEAAAYLMALSNKAASPAAASASSSTGSEPSTSAGEAPRQRPIAPDASAGGAAASAAGATAAQLATAAVPPVAAASSASDRVATQLLLGKVYSSWRGHDADALGVYDRLIQSDPEDYRAFLARGVYLKSQGRRADADRMFLQAKFYAPESRQALVRSMTSTNPVLDLPENN